jgi:hypothetical protein
MTTSTQRPQYEVQMELEGHPFVKKKTKQNKDQHRFFFSHAWQGFSYLVQKKGIGV